MSTIAIVILVAIGLVIMMRLNDREAEKDYAPYDQGFITRRLYSRYRGSRRYHCSCSSGVPRLFLATKMARCERLNCSDDRFRVQSI
jgi:hypothetical protein